MCAVELDPYCREVLLRRQEEKHLEPFPVWDDIRTFDGRPWRGAVDVVTAGFPCQPFSVAGKQEGKDDERNLWPETIRIIREVGPRFVLLENVPGLLAHDYYGEIIGELAEAGYDAEWEIVSAAEVGAPHLRKRLWIIANASREQLRDESGGLGRKGRTCASIASDDGQEESLANAKGNGREQGRTEPAGEQGRPNTTERGESLANADSRGFQGQREQSLHDGKWSALGDDANRRGGEVPDSMRSGLGGGDDEPVEHRDATGRGWWATEPNVGRVAHGVPHRVDRLKALGNGQVPGVVREAWNRLTEGE
mgnify:CR=1 FL=1